MLGDGWRQAAAPGISRELIDMARLDPPPETVLWYAGQTGACTACVRSRTADGCRISAHAFNQRPEHGLKNWSYLASAGSWQTCP